MKSSLLTNSGPGRPSLLWVAEAFGILTAICFVATVWIYGQIFRGWGLDYPSIATPSDVIMDGIGLTSDALWYAAWMALAFAVAWILSRIQIRPVKIALDVVIGTLSVLLIWLPLLTPGNDPTTSNFDVSRTTGSLLSIAFAGSLSWLLLRVRWRLVGPTRRTVADASLTVACIVFALSIVAEQVRQFGYVGDDIEGAELQPMLEGCDNFSAVWIGSRAVVMRCSVNGGSQRQYRENRHHWVYYNPGPFVAFDPLRTEYAD